MSGLRGWFAAALILLGVSGTAPSFAQETTGLTPDQRSTQPSVQQVGKEHTFNETVRYGTTARSWRTEIRAPGSPYIKVHFASLRLAAGDYITVADPAGREVHTYHGDPTRGGRGAGDAGFTRHGPTGFAAMSIDGDTAVVTLHATARRANAAELTRQDFGVRIDRYFRGMTDSELADAGVLSVCGTDARRDAVCYRDSHPVPYERSRAVAKSLIKGIFLCTAWRVGNTNRMLTNNHCIANAEDLAATEFTFGSDCATCGGNDPVASVKVGGGRFLKTSPRAGGLDYTLVTVADFARIRQFGTLYLDVREPTLGEPIYIAGHGTAKPKRLSIYTEAQGGATCEVDQAVVREVNMGYECDTTPGSSGSPVFAASSNRVIALHHSGGCPDYPNSGTRITLVYNEIRDLIDNGPPAGRDFSVSVSPAAGTIQPGQTSDATVTTATTAGEPLDIALTATGLPDEAQVEFTPGTVPSGSPATMAITAGALTPPGTYPITVTGTGATGARSTTYRLTVTGTDGACPGYETTRTGSLTSGATAYQPDGRYFQTTASGVHRACLAGPTGSDFDLYLERWNGWSWTTVASGATPSADETLTYNAAAGYYRYRVVSYSGNGTYTLAYDAP